MLHLWWRERGETWDGWCSWMELERKVQETSPDGEAWHSAQRWEMPSDSTGGMITGNQVRFDALHRMRNCRKIIRLKFLFFLFFRNSIFVEIFESFPLCRHACIHSFIHSSMISRVNHNNIIWAFKRPCSDEILQVGMILRGMGFDNTTSVYVASGKIYKEDKYMAPLRQLFPRLETKYTLASTEELAPFEVLAQIHSPAMDRRTRLDWWISGAGPLFQDGGAWLCRVPCQWGVPHNPRRKLSSFYDGPPTIPLRSCEDDQTR